MLKLNRLCKQFNGIRAVDKVTLKIKKGEIVGLLGPNGAGKTTTLRMIAGVLPPTSGNVFIKGKNLKDNEKDLKKLIGFLPENNPLYEELTVEEHLSFFKNLKGVSEDEKKETIDFVVKNTGIADVYYRPVSELSKGYRQRVGLSQALLRKPDILILDEPVEGLDPNQRQEIQQLIKNLGKERTIIISSHVLSEVAKICSRIIIIHRGRVVADDTPEDLLKGISSKACLIEAEIKGKNIIPTLRKIKGVKKIEEKKKGYFIIEAEGEKDLREEIYKTAVSKKWILLTLFQKQIDLEEVFRELTKE